MTDETIETVATPSPQVATEAPADAAQAGTEPQPVIEPVPPVPAEPIVTAEVAVETAAVDEKKAAENAGHSFLERIAEKLGGDLELAKTWLEDKIAAL